MTWTVRWQPRPSSWRSVVSAGSRSCPTCRYRRPRRCRLHNHSLLELYLLYLPQLPSLSARRVRSNGCYHRRSTPTKPWRDRAALRRGRPRIKPWRDCAALLCCRRMTHADACPGHHLEATGRRQHSQCQRSSFLIPGGVRYMRASWSVLAADRTVISSYGW